MEIFLCETVFQWYKLQCAPHRGYGKHLKLMHQIQMAMFHYLLSQIIKNLQKQN